jgi:hypothetical protein
MRTGRIDQQGKQKVSQISASPVVSDDNREVARFDIGIPRETGNPDGVSLILATP